jgi:hypothetical protein
MALRKPGQGVRIPYVAVVLLGDPKIGKTRMAGMFPDAYFMDFDEGAGHVDAVSNTYPRNATGFDVALTEVKRMARLQPDETGALQHTVDGYTFPVRTLVLDTLTELQNYGRLKLEANNNYFNKQRFYGDILDVMREFITVARSVNCNLVMNVHTKTKVEEEGEGRNKQVWESVDIRLEGSIRDLLPGWADAILYLVNDPKQGKKFVLTQETRIGHRIYMAGDRDHIFQGQQLPLYKNGNGSLNADIVKKLLSITEGGQRIQEVEPWKLGWKNGIEPWLREKGYNVDEAKALLKEEYGDFDPENMEAYYSFLKAHFEGEMAASQ